MHSLSTVGVPHSRRDSGGRVDALPTHVVKGEYGDEK